jgi:spore maturation protein CgeB
MPDPPYATVRVYEPTEEAARHMLREAAGADLVVKASGVGVLDAFLEKEVAALARSGCRTAFWDVDAPATLSRVEQNPADPFADLIPQYHYIFTYGGGQPVTDRYRALGATLVQPLYNALDQQTHPPVPADPAFSSDLAFLGNRLPDREERVEEFFIKPASLLPEYRFLLGGNGWADKPLPANIRTLGHVSTNDHNAFNVTPMAVLNICRESMATNGWSPATRVFEAAGAGAFLITDYWLGVEDFLEPGKEVLVARSGEEVAEILRTLDPQKAGEIGEAARKKIISRHTYAHRASLFDEIVSTQLANP